MSASVPDTMVLQGRGEGRRGREAEGQRHSIGVCSALQPGQRMACGPERTAPTSPIWVQVVWGPHWQGLGLVAGAGGSAPGTAGSGLCLMVAPRRLE